jgi:arylsulfatase A-like enzyme
MQPNFIAILVDDLRYDEFGAGGHPYKLKNLARSASHAAIRASLRREMRRLVADAAGI